MEYSESKHKTRMALVRRYDLQSFLKVVGFQE